MTRRLEAPPSVGYTTYGLDRPLAGIGRYAVELATALKRYEDQDQIDLTLITPFPGAAAGLDEFFPSARIRGRLLPTYMLAGPLQIALAARRRRLDVVHDPFGVSPFLIPRRLMSFGRITTIHDVIPFIMPETHARLTNILFRHYIPRSLPFVDYIITDSESSKRDIIRFFACDPERVRVIPCGVSERFAPAPAQVVKEMRERYKLPDHYILTLGTLQARKNLPALFDAYHLLRQRGVNHRLVVVGQKAWKTTELFARLRDLGLEDEVILTGFVSDNDLPAVYSGASAFAFPSLYEGFGLPPLEAMACGTPVITSNTSSLPELVSGAGMMVSPEDVAGLADGLQQLIDDQTIAECYRKRGLERASQFTWDQAAREHLGLYQTVADEYRSRSDRHRRCGIG